ncbi:MAG: xanthine dehydrogenase family protein molybdopterin-binding subunit, partial [Acidimicrobiales bacterium]
MTAIQPRPSYKYVGTRPIRHDGLDKVTGKARYAADLILPGMLAGHVLRSPHAHARIVSIDTTAAEAMPGVKAVVTSADFPELQPDDEHYKISNNLMARDKVLYEGHALAAVAAGTRAQAQAAAEAIAVSYEVLDHVLTVDEAMADGACVLHDDLITSGVEPTPTEASNVVARTLFERGDVEAGFAQSDVVVERQFTTRAIHQAYIEPHAVIADTGQDGKSVVWGSSQGHFKVRSASAAMLGWDTAR